MYRPPSYPFDPNFKSPLSDKQIKIRLGIFTSILLAFLVWMMYTLTTLPAEADHQTITTGEVEQVND